MFAPIIIAVVFGWHVVATGPTRYATRAECDSAVAAMTAKPSSFGGRVVSSRCEKR